MAVDAQTKEVLEEIGDPEEVDRELQSFRKAAHVLSSQRPRMIDRYSKRWIAIYRGRVKAEGRTFQSLMTQLDKMNLPRQQTIVRFIDKDERTMIL